MKELLTEIQKEKYLSVSGKEFSGVELEGRFLTDRPYNNKEWNMSPWIFSYVIEKETGYLICELDHRMTNNRVYGWDRDGNELSEEVTSKHFRSFF